MTDTALTVWELLRSLCVLVTITMISVSFFSSSLLFLAFDASVPDIVGLAVPLGLLTSLVVGLLYVSSLLSKRARIRADKLNN